MLWSSKLPRLYGANISEIVTAALDGLTRKTAEDLEDQMNMESRPYTLNQELFTVLTEKLQTDIINYRATESPGSLNHYTTEIDVISKVLSYVKIAYFRFIDVIAIRVEHNFQNKLRDEIFQGMIARLLSGEGHEEACRAYLEDDPDIAARRADLNRQMEIVKVAEQELKKVQVGD
jgi:Dynamin GTPase effector domain